MKKRYMGVTAYTGLPGSGKTLTMAEVGCKAKAKGRTVWANADETGKRPWFRPADRHFKTHDDFLALVAEAVEHGTQPVILWDELPIYVNARKWQEFPDGLLYQLSQIRKDGMELHYTAMDMAMVDINVRRITFREWKCNALGLGLHRRVLWGAPEFRKRDDKRIRGEYFRVKPDVAESYNSWGKVSAPLAPVLSSDAPAPAGVPAPAGQPVRSIADRRRAQARR
jgi:hypothetical protein